MSFLTGIVGKTLLEVLKGLFFQIGWKIILERFASRLVVWGLEALEDGQHQAGRAYANPACGPGSLQEGKPLPEG